MRTRWRTVSAIAVRYSPGEAWPWEVIEFEPLESGIVGRSAAHSYFRLTPRGRLEINPGYRWNGPSGAIPTPDWIRASCAHDALYQGMRSGMLPRSLRREADRLMRQLLCADGPQRGWLRVGLHRSLAWCYWATVRLLGWRYTRREDGDG